MVARSTLSICNRYSTGRWLAGSLCLVSVMIGLRACVDSAADSGERARGTSNSAVTVLPVVVNLGSITDSAPARGSFEIINGTGTDVTIQNIQSTCSCTAAEPPSGRIGPRSSLRIPIVFTPTLGIGGDSSQTLMVSIQSRTGLEQIPVMVKAEVRLSKTLTAVPLHVDFGGVPHGKYEQTIWISGSERALSAIPSTFELRDGKAVVVDVDLLPDNYSSRVQRRLVISISSDTERRAKAFKSEFRFHNTSSSGEPDLVIPVTAMFMPSVTVTPERLLIAVDSVSGTGATTVSFSHRSETPVNVRKITSDLNIFSRPAEGRHAWTIGYSDQSHVLAGPLSGTVSVELVDYVDQIRIPVEIVPFDSFKVSRVVP